MELTSRCTLKLERDKLLSTGSTEGYLVLVGLSLSGPCEAAKFCTTVALEKGVPTVFLLLVSRTELKRMALI